MVQARKEWKNNKQYTSARLHTHTKFRHGVFEMRAKLPWARGTWPAFWLLKYPRDWPNGGEIDIMEHTGNQLGKISSAVHCEAYNGRNGNTPTWHKWVSGVEHSFHVYQLEWTPTSIKTYVDGEIIFERYKNGNDRYREWPFNDANFEIVLNLAVGGSMGGNVDSSWTHQNFVIDYVRVYNLA